MYIHLSLRVLNLVKSIHTKLLFIDVLLEHFCVDTHNSFSYFQIIFLSNLLRFIQMNEDSSTNIHF